MKMMQQLADTTGTKTNRMSDRQRVEKVVEALATLGNLGETLEEVAHDARNMVTALGLYCDLLEEPGVLATPFVHYGPELRLVAAASRRLVEKLVALDAHVPPGNALSARRPGAQPSDPGLDSRHTLCGDSNVYPGHDPSLGFLPQSGPNPSRISDSTWRRDLLPALPVTNLAAELLANRNLLAALAGPAVAVTVDAQGGAQPVRLTTEDLTRVLVNLVKNAGEAMPKGGRIHLSLSERPPANGTLSSVVLAIEDNGPGIPADALDKIFTAGFTTSGTTGAGPGNFLWAHRGLGLSIIRSIVEAAGGRVSASNRPQGGARFLIELPLRKSSFQPSAFSS
jgi:hypothetical protein